MICENDATKCFNIVWKLINASYSLPKDGKAIESPSFTVEGSHKANFRLILDLSSGKEIGVFLRREKGKPLDLWITVELAFLSYDGKVLQLDKGDYYDGDENEMMGADSFGLINEVFYEKRALFLPQDTLTIRCRIWRCEGDFLKNVQYFARTSVGVEKRSFFWNIDRFNSLSLSSKQKYEVKSLDNSKKFMSLELFLTSGMIYDEKIRLKMYFHHKYVKNFTLQVFMVDTFKNNVKCFEDEVFARDRCVSKRLTLFYSKSELIKERNRFLPNDTLSLLFKCVFSFGIELEEIEIGNYDPILKQKPNNVCLLNENDLTVQKSILADDFKKILSSSLFSDVKLHTKTRAYPAHKCILSARSPVFQAMLANDMQENINVVNLYDMNDSIATRLLNYIYNAEVGELEWGIATELYEAADKYQIPDLRNICSTYLRENLRPSGACKLLLLANLHQDKHLKRFVQDFILQHGTDIINSEEWDHLMENNIKLAAETMRLNFKSNNTC